MKKQILIVALMAAVLLGGCRKQRIQEIRDAQRAQSEAEAVAMSEEPLAESGQQEAEAAAAETEGGVPAGTAGAAAGAGTGTAADGGAQAQAEPAQQVDVRNVMMDVSGRREGNSVYFEVESSLPDQEYLTVTLSYGDFNTSDYFLAGERIVSVGGTAKTSAFSDHGAALSGKYDLGISLRMSEEQDLIIRSTNGDQGSGSVIIRASDVAKAQEEKANNAAARQGQATAGANAADGTLAGQDPAQGVPAGQQAGTSTGAAAAGTAAAGAAAQDDGKITVTAFFTVSIGGSVSINPVGDYQYTILREEGIDSALLDPAGLVPVQPAQPEQTAEQQQQQPAQQPQQQTTQQPVYQQQPAQQSGQDAGNEGGEETYFESEEPVDEVDFIEGTEESQETETGGDEDLIDEIIE